MTEQTPAPVVVVDPRSDWVVRARALSDALTSAAPERVIRVEHIGSTSVPGLPAKDVVDMQVVVDSFRDRDAIVAALCSPPLSLRHGTAIVDDHVPAGWLGDPREWAKIVFSGEHGGGRCNVHVRVAGSANARYAVLFRDYLRANALARDSWATFKARLAEIADDLEEYGRVKDAATDVLMLAAEQWAEDTGWLPGRGAP
ncbi:MAG: GrpB family protein [Actinomycetota bacterium]